MRAYLPIGLLGLAAALACLTVGGCNPFTNSNKDADGDGFTAARFGGDDCNDADPAIHPDAPELCNGIDDNCSGEADDGPDQDHDGHRACDCDDDNDRVYPGAREDCNGRDDDCDDQTDEDLGDQTCPLKLGVCQGVEMVCLGEQGWSDCDYGADFEAGDEARCDGLDNDCDGETDENLASVPCAVENQWGTCPGIQTCQGAAGLTACDAADPAAEACDGLDNDCDGQTDEGLLLLVPEQGAQASDGIDNNCNGLVDEPGGVMVPIPGMAGTWVDAYEMTIFANSDCTGQRYGEASDDYPAEWPAEQGGTVDLFACSLPGQIPSGHLSWWRVWRACLAQGKRMCTDFEYRPACDGNAFNLYPYAAVFVPGICNDPFGGDGAPAPAGSFEGCTADGTTFDMSGNLAEWVDTELEDELPGYHPVAGYGYPCELYYLGDPSPIVCDPDDPDSARDYVEAVSQCPVYDFMGGQYFEYRAFLAATVKPFFGGRCCYP